MEGTYKNLSMYNMKTVLIFLCTCLECLFPDLINKNMSTETSHITRHFKHILFDSYYDAQLTVLHSCSTKRDYLCKLANCPLFQLYEQSFANLLL